MPAHKAGLKASIKNKIKQVKIRQNNTQIKKPTKRSAWTCICGCVIPKQGASLSGGQQYKEGYHVHCPNCSRTVAQYVDPKETR